MSKKFTLIELLVVVAIIGILASMLLPSLSKAREKTKIAVCKSNLKQQVMMFYMYAGDSDSKYPTAVSQSRWPLGHYINNEAYLGLYKSGYYEDGQFLYCPSFKGSWITYEANFNPTGNLYTGYAYWINYGRALTATPDDIAVDVYSDGETMMLSDKMVVDSQGSFAKSNHTFSGKMDGGNIAKNDGSIIWRSSVGHRYTHHLDFYY